MSDIDPWEGDDDDPPIMESKVALHGDLYGKVKGICKMRGMTISEYMTRILCAVLGLHHADYAVRSTHTADLPDRVDRRLERLDELEAQEREHRAARHQRDALIRRYLTDKQRDVLLACRDHPMTAQEIAQATDLSPNHASKTLHDMYTNGILTRAKRTDATGNPLEYTWPGQDEEKG